MSHLSRDPVWRAMFARLDAAARSQRQAEAERWADLSDDQKVSEMALAARRWEPCRHLDRISGLVTKYAGGREA